ncbi:hypothetical protein, conserved [Eimeria brunetti]|uniref:Transmembrane protein n=1 Tax=Eimeria brunetti TaxID=51314 RepID=U6LIZ9_9EIME|nr:hypothetical protein, conserved [Eimeria brunetti]
MVGREAFPQHEWAGLPLSGNEDDRQLRHAFDRPSAPWWRKGIRHDGFSGRFQGNLRQKRIALTLVAFGALAVTFAVLRCAVQRFPHRTAGDDERSLVEGKPAHSPSACVGGRAYGFERGFAPGATLSEQQLQQRASGVMDSLVSVLKENEPVLARIPVPTRSKILSLLLSLVVQELAALASVLDENSRGVLTETVREVGMIIRRLGTTVTRKTGGVCSRRLQIFLGDVLRRLELSGPQGVRLPSAERSRKLQDLLRLQEVMLVNLREVFNNFIVLLSPGNEPNDDTLNAAKNSLGDLLHARKEHIFLDPLLSRWLLAGNNHSKRFAVASPGRLAYLRQIAPRTIDDMVDELRALSVGRRDRRAGQHRSAPADEAKASTHEPGDLPPTEEALQATAMSTGVHGDRLESSHVLQVPQVSDQAHIPDHSQPAGLDAGGESGRSELIAQPPEQRSNESVPAFPPRDTQVGAVPVVISLSYRSTDLLHALSRTSTVVFPLQS